MKKFLTVTIIAIIVLIGLSVSVNAADVATEADLKNALLTDGTVKLSGDIEITESIRTSTNVTVDLNGFKITGPDDGVANWYAFIVEGGVFTLKDTSEAQTGELYAKCFGIETKAGIFIMESGKITATKNEGIGAAVVNYGGKVEIKGGTLVAAYSAVDCQSCFSDAELVISGGTFETTLDADAAIDIGGEYSNGTETATISGGTFKGVNAFAVNANTDSSVSITGGKFESDISDFVTGEYDWAYDDEGNMVVFVPIYLDEPTNVKWNGTKATWDAVPNADGYGIILYNGAWSTQPIWVDGTSYDFSEYLTDKNAEYVFEVWAEGNGNPYYYSDNVISDEYVFPAEEEPKVEEDKPTSGQGTAVQQPEEDKEGEKDDTPPTGSIDVLLFASAIVAVISVAGIVTVKKYTR